MTVDNISKAVSRSFHFKKLSHLHKFHKFVLFIANDELNVLFINDLHKLDLKHRYLWSEGQGTYLPLSQASPRQLLMLIICIITLSAPEAAPWQPL